MGLKKLLPAFLALSLLLFGCKSNNKLSELELKTHDGSYFSFEEGRRLSYYNYQTGEIYSARDSNHEDPWDEITIQGCFTNTTYTTEDRGYKIAEGLVCNAISSMVEEHEKTRK